MAEGRINSSTAVGYLRAVLVLAVSVALASPATQDVSNQVGAAVALLVSISCILLVAVSNRSRPIGLGSVFLALLLLFHLPLAVPAALNMQPEQLQDDSFRWIDDGYLGQAFVIVAFGVAVFTGVYLLATAYLANRVVPDRILGNQGTAAIVVPFSLVTAGVGVWYYEVLSSGALSFSAVYRDYIDSAGGSQLPLAYLMIGVGLGIAGGLQRPKARLWVAAVFVSFAIPAFLIGLRGEVIVPLAAYIAARSTVTKFRPNWRWILALVAFLSVGAFVKESRQQGLASAFSNGLAIANPFDGLYELGFSIRPLVLVLELFDTGDTPTGAHPYIAPIMRPLNRFILGGQYTPTSEDYGVFNTMVRERAGNIGGSPIAEAWRAQPVTGLVVVMVCVALFIAMLDQAGRFGRFGQGAAAVGALGYPLLLWVRNEFTPVLSSIGFGLAAVLVFGFFARNRYEVANGREANWGSN